MPEERMKVLREALVRVTAGTMYLHCMEFGCADFSSLQREERLHHIIYIIYMIYMIYMIYITGRVWLTVFLSLVTGLMYSPAG